MSDTKFKSGFVSILGRPNVGKSTLMNALIGDRLSIVTAKAQTTRHRIFGIISGHNFQLVYSDTPGVIDPQYELQQNMMRFVKASLEDADVILWVVELGEKFDKNEIAEILINTHIPVILIINKIDLGVGSQVVDKLTYWEELLPGIPKITVSALQKTNLDPLFEMIMEKIPIHPPYFPDDTLTDRSERFMVSEVIREKIFLNYKKEVPYSCEVAVEEFHESDSIIRIRAIIYVERDSQKGIIVGKKGDSIKKVGMAARKDLEAFFSKQIHLETYVKVEKNWRSKAQSLKRFGYVQ